MRAGPGFVPLIDMGDGTYLGFTGGLYPDGSNEIPAVHAAAGLERAAAVQPLDTDGDPHPNGKYIMLSVGMSNTSQEYCGIQSNGVNCNDWAFMGQAAADPLVEHTDLVMVNGAAGGQTADTWDSPDDDNYDRVRDLLLAPLGLSEAQVQIVWLKVANGGPTVSLPAEDADAHQLESAMGDIARALRIRYPNLQLVFVSSRIYAGYATTTLNPEPYAYESGFAVKWLIEAQIEQVTGEPIDPHAGDLNYDTVAPWLGWGPYLWADGITPRSDGLTWVPGNFEEDGTHPSESGESTVAEMLLGFFSTSEQTSCWFLANRFCSRNSAYLPVLFSSGPAVSRFWWPEKAR